MEDKLISEFQKNAIEKVRIFLREYRGKKLVDIRIWVEREKGELIPTKKGLSLTIEKYPSLQEALKSLEKELGKNSQMLKQK